MMKKIILTFLAVTVVALQSADAQNYPSGSWVRPVTPQNMPRQSYQQNYQMQSAPTLTKIVRLVNTATIDQSGQ